MNKEIKKRGKYGLLAETKDWPSENNREERSRQHVQIKKQVFLKVLFWSYLRIGNHDHNFLRMVTPQNKFHPNRFKNTKFKFLKFVKQKKISKIRQT